MDNFRYSALGFGEFCEIPQGVTALRIPSLSRGFKQASGLFKCARGVKPLCFRVQLKELPSESRAQRVEGENKHLSAYFNLAILKIKYSILSTSAFHEASITFSETPTVPHIDCPDFDSIRTRTRAAVPALLPRTLTL